MLNYGSQPDVLGSLTAGQRSMWAVQQLQPEVPYNFAGFLAIDHDVDVEGLLVACETAAARFGTQCARLSLVDGEPVFIVDRLLPQNLRSLRCIDLRAESDPVAAAHSWMNNDYHQPIDLAADPLTDLALLRITDNLSYFYLRAHHVLFDGYGANNFIRHIAAAYSGSVADITDVDFSEFALIRDADRKYQQSARSQADAEYWRTIVRGSPEVTDLGGGRRSAAPRHPQMRELVCRHLLENYQLDVARVIATMALFIAKTTGRQNVSMSLPVSARTTAALKRCAGMVANMVPLRICVDDGDTIGALTDQVAKALVGALRHQQFRRWPDLIADTTHLDNLDFGPIINILDFATPFRFGSSEPMYHVLTNGPVQDIAVNIYPRLGHGAPRIQFAWNPDRYSADDIARHLTRLELLFDRLLVADGSVVVGEVSLLDRGERDLVLWGWSGARVGAPVGVVSQVLAAAVAADAEAVAVIDGARQVSYRELDEWSTRVARVLIEVGVGPARAVGVAMDRCAELVVAWWAVVKAGGVYVPVDVGHPVERVAAVLDAVDAVCVLSCGADSVAGAGGRPVIRLDGVELAGRRADPITDAERLGPLGVEDTAYVIFTSGSTGVPKGVAVGHGGLLGVAAAQRALFGVGERARILMVAAPTFDASIFEWLWAAGSAAAVVVAPAGVYAGEPLSCLLHQQQVSAAILTPTVLASLDRARLGGLQTLIAGAEPCPPELVSAWAPGRRMFNAYGPTEATIWATCTAPLSAGQPVSIGAPIPGVCALVLDARLDPAPIGVVGELYLAGPALAHGYVGQAQLTAERFVANPYGEPGARMYRTGDLVRWTPEATLECLGRADTQVKLRGQRIELGDIENALLACPQVTQAAATVHHTPTGTAHLIAYISGSPALEPTAIRQLLSGRLPAYLVPAQVVVLDEFPLTSSGKLDRNALPAPVFAAAAYRPPQTATENIVADVFADVLGVDRVGLDDDFFALGGDSLLATRVSTRLQLALDTAVPVRYLFDTPTVADLANQLHRCRGAIPVQEVVPIQTLKKGTGVPLFCIHPGGGMSWPYHALGNYLDRPIIGIQQILQGEETEPRSIRDMAKNYADRIQGVYPTGPYNLLGWSFGGVIAHELAIELQRRGCVIAHLIVLDADPRIDHTQDLGDWSRQIEVLRFYGIAIPEHDEPLTYEQIEAAVRDSGAAAEFPRYKQLLDLFVQNITSGMALYRTHQPDVFDGDMIIFSAVRGESDRSWSLLQSWRPYVAGDITVHAVDSTHQEMLTTESLRRYGRQLERSLIRVASGDLSGLVCGPGQVVARTTPKAKWSRAGQTICAVGMHVHQDQRQRVTQSSSDYPGRAL